MNDLRRTIGLPGAIGIAVSSMIGAGLFAVFAPAAASAGRGLYVALLIAGVVATANAISSARLAVRYPESGGTYVYATRQLHPAAGHVAGWAFVIGKTASCAAMAHAIGSYVWTDQARWVGTATVVLLTALALSGVTRSTIAIMVIAGAATAAVVAAAAAINSSGVDRAGELSVVPASVPGVLQGAALLFFAFAGYARLTTMGEEVQRPAKTIPVAIAISVGLVGLLYLLAAFTLVRALGADLATAPAPWSQALDLSGFRSWVTVMMVIAAISAAGALLAVCLGVSRTALAMARDRHLPPALAGVNRAGVPAVAEVVTGLAAITVLWTLDLPASIGFSSCFVLIYYGLAQASAARLPGLAGKVVAVIGLLGCVLLALSLPMVVWASAVILLAGLALTRSRRPARPTLTH